MYGIFFLLLLRQWSSLGFTPRVGVGGVTFAKFFLFWGHHPENFAHMYKCSVLTLATTRRIHKGNWNVVYLWNVILNFVKYVILRDWHIFLHWKPWVVMVLALSPVVAPEVVMTTYVVTCDNKIIIITTLCFQCSDQFRFVYPWYFSL